jgi:hypothetical protein
MLHDRTPLPPHALQEDLVLAIFLPFLKISSQIKKMAKIARYSGNLFVPTYIIDGVLSRGVYTNVYGEGLRSEAGRIHPTDFFCGAGAFLRDGQGQIRRAGYT